MRKPALAAVLSALLCGPPAGAAEDSEQTRETMRQIYRALQTALPLSADAARFRDPALEPEVRRALRLLSEQAAALADHAAGPDVGFDYLGNALARHASEAYRDYNARRYETAQTLVQQASNFCVACHSRLPDPGRSPLADGFITQDRLAGLTRQQKARLLVATRRFDAAIDVYESLIGDPSVHPAELTSGALTDYLILCIRVKSDLDRPVPPLRRFAGRADLTPETRSEVRRWIDDLRRLRDEADKPATLERGRELIDSVNAPDSFAMDRRPRVYYIVASGVLNRFIRNRHDRDARDKRDKKDDLAEAYYLLGLAEYRIGRDFWVVQADHYLETAIRLAPRTDAARRAYALLEEETVFGFSGSSGTHIPDDVQRHLDALRGLIDQR